jgi:enamine deaminase RidA (YjgF/YER057c/UK114 family)
MHVETRLRELGLTLPQPPKLPPNVHALFEWVRVRGNRAFVSGHAALKPDGTPAGPFGKVEVEVTVEQATESARQAAVAMLASLQRTLGDLDRVAAWLTVTAFVNAVSGSIQTTNVINGASSLLLELFGADAGQHARFAIGATALPLNTCVVIGAELEIAS